MHACRVAPGAARCVPAVSFCCLASESTKPYVSAMSAVCSMASRRLPVVVARHSQGCSWRSGALRLLLCGVAFAAPTFGSADVGPCTTLPLSLVPPSPGTTASTPAPFSPPVALPSARAPSPPPALLSPPFNAPQCPITSAAPATRPSAAPTVATPVANEPTPSPLRASSPSGLRAFASVSRAVFAAIAVLTRWAVAFPVRALLVAVQLLAVPLFVQWLATTDSPAWIVCARRRAAACGRGFALGAVASLSFTLLLVDVLYEPLLRLQPLSSEAVDVLLAAALLGLVAVVLAGGRFVVCRLPKAKPGPEPCSPRIGGCGCRYAR